eukprot:gene13197-13328_t
MSDKLDGDALWQLLGRDTTAGKALYNIYNSDNLHGRATGLIFSEKNRQLFKKLATKTSAAALSAGPTKDTPSQKQQKPTVAVPRFKSKAAASPTSPATDNLAHLPRRRNGQQILACMAADAEQAWGRSPAPTGPLLDEQEKERCALLMQHKGRLPSGSDLTGKAKAGGVRHGQQVLHKSIHLADSDPLLRRRKMLQQRFQEVAAEIEEREEFISTMQQLGQLKEQHVAIVRGEVAAKVRELGQLDQQISQLDMQTATRADSTPPRV